MRQIFSFIFICLSIVLHAQNIVGHVVDEATGENIGFASVQYKDHHVAAITDLSGRFTIQRHKGWKLTVAHLYGRWRYG